MPQFSYILCYPDGKYVAYHSDVAAMTVCGAMLVEWHPCPPNPLGFIWQGITAKHEYMIIIRQC